MYGKNEYQSNLVLVFCIYVSMRMKFVQPMNHFSAQLKLQWKLLQLMVTENRTRLDWYSFFPYNFSFSYSFTHRSSILSTWIWQREFLVRSLFIISVPSFIGITIELNWSLAKKMVNMKTCILHLTLKLTHHMNLSVFPFPLHCLRKLQYWQVFEDERW